MGQRQPDFFRKMSEGLLEQLEELARKPGTTGLECLKFLTDSGIKTSESSVYRWLQDFRLEYKAGRVSESARTYIAAVKEADPTAVTKASLLKFDELIFEGLMNADPDDALELMRLGRSLKTGTATRRDLQQLEEKAKAGLEKISNSLAKGELTQSKIDEVRKGLFG